MSIKTKKFVKNGVEVRAVKLTHRNLFNLAEWCKGEYVVDPQTSKDDFAFSKSQVRIRVKTRKGIRVAKPGDYIVKDADGKFSVGKADVFDVEYALA
jgi:hypothetical protein